eukprot:TRINITY_DN37337_c0_g1_i1.p2 TRINITY_DN37337_c0_g1~~TRINITY_DN37337_c0_g1_i1.p2  ORF type:complete len:100 (+),score=1.14 TRINITY_DN37337_c0_g1_i1:414-713(+)
MTTSRLVSSSPSITNLFTKPFTWSSSCSILICGFISVPNAPAVASIPASRILCTIATDFGTGTRDTINYKGKCKLTIPLIKTGSGKEERKLRDYHTGGH